MSNPYEVKVGIVQNITGPVLFQNIPISDENKLRVVISNSTGSNVIVIRARITGQDDFDVLSIITGNNKSVVNISLYDELQIECTTYGSTSNHVKVVLSSFSPAGGSTTIDAPTGGSVSNDEIVFTSSDNSITIVASPSTNTIDFVTSSVGSPFIKYVKTVLLADWVGPSVNEYTLTINYSEHGVISPNATCYELNGLSYDNILVPIKVDASYNIIITVPQTPDSRFIGKIVIE